MFATVSPPLSGLSMPCQMPRRAQPRPATPRRRFLRERFPGHPSGERTNRSTQTLGDPFAAVVYSDGSTRQNRPKAEPVAHETTTGRHSSNTVAVLGVLGGVGDQIN